MNSKKQNSPNVTYIDLDVNDGADAFVEALAKNAHCPCRGLAIDRRQFDSTNQAKVTNIDDIWLAFQAVQSVLKRIF